MAVPWVAVLSNAPAMVDAAHKLWKLVSRKTGEAPRPEQEAPPDGALAETRLAALEADVASLNAEMLETSRLLRDLADQNALLVARVEQNRLRMRWLGGLAVLSVVLALVGLVAALN